MDAFYWSRAASRAVTSQGLSLDLARLNQRGSQARKAWLESAALDASRKRMCRRFHMEGIGQTLAPTHGARLVTVGGFLHAAGAA